MKCREIFTEARGTFKNIDVISLTQEEEKRLYEIVYVNV